MATHFSDIDECENDDHECGENSVCQNSPGGYSCTCKVDYMGDGYNCTGRPVVDLVNTLP